LAIGFSISPQFQNRRTKWKKQENVSHTEATEHKSNGSTKGSEFHSSESSSPITTGKSGKSIAAELNAKITAKQNSRLKLQHNGVKSAKHMEPPKLKSHAMHHPHKTSSSNYDMQFAADKSYHNFHDVESRLTASKISISDLKAKASAPSVALNLKRSYL